MKCVFLFPVQLLSETFFFVRKIERDTITNVDWSWSKVQRRSKHSQFVS